MRHTGLVLVTLLAATQLSACATGHSLRGDSGQVSWEIVDIKQALVAGGAEMRWEFSIVLKNVGSTGIALEQVEISSRAGGTGDVWGGMGTAPFAHRLEPGGELRINQSESWGCPQCAPAHLPRVFAEGVFVYYTLSGRDDAGAKVRVPITVRLDSSVGTRE